MEGFPLIQVITLLLLIALCKGPEITVIFIRIKLYGTLNDKQRDSKKFIN